jgi:Kef-type K+ transport system membrane component KefB
MESPFASLVGVATIAFLIPFTLGFFPRLRVPVVVAELIAGIVFGPAVLGWIQVTPVITTMASLGVAFLLFLAGMELDLGELQGPPARRGALSFAMTFALALAVTIPLGMTGHILSPLLVAIALSATSVGIIVPVLRDTGLLSSNAGLHAMAGGAVAEFATIAMLGIFFATNGGSALEEVILIVMLAVAALIALTLLRRTSNWKPGKIILDRLDETTSQPRVRGAVLLMLAAGALSLKFGFEPILGTFLAGIIFAIIIRGDRFEERLRMRVEAIGFGFLVPIFFITSGLRFDTHGLVGLPSVVLVGLFALILLFVHLTPALVLHTRSLGLRTATAVGMLQATNLSFIVVAVEVGRQIGKLRDVNASALILAGLVSAIAFPPIAQALLGGAAENPEPTSGPLPGVREEF